MDACTTRTRAAVQRFRPSGRARYTGGMSAPRAPADASPVRTRRWNDPARPGDGARILVCRYRPRGVPKRAETWDEWQPALAPSRALHAAYWGKAGPAIDWPEYRRRFLVEMAEEPARRALRALRGRLAAGEHVTLLCSSACPDQTRCHRTLLRDLLLAG
jgi:uncharacterized protein YeaO (DUF488 family)